MTRRRGEVAVVGVIRSRRGLAEGRDEEAMADAVVGARGVTGRGTLSCPRWRGQRCPWLRLRRVRDQLRAVA